MGDTPTPNGQHTTILDDHRNESVRFDSGVEFADVYSACISPTQFPQKQQYNLSHHPFLIEEYSDHSLPRCKRTNSRWRYSELSLSKRLANHSSSSTIIRYENPDTVKSRLKSPLLVSLMSQRMHRPGVMDNERFINTVHQDSTHTTKGAKTPAYSSQTSSLPYSARTSSES
jgi:pyruvate/2-oxoacid:ferredoxin oxidoreductase beta subunit